MKRLLFLLFSVSAFGQYPLQEAPYQLIDGRNGAAKAISNGYVYTYAAGTTTPLATYTSYTLGTPLPNPVRTNTAGYAVSGSGAITGIWTSGTACYHIVIKDSSAVTIADQDHLCNPAQAATTVNTALLAYEALLASASGSSHIGFLQPQSNAVAETVQAKLRQSIDVKDFGAVGDDAHNDTTALNACILAGQLTNGHVCGVSAGVYRHSGLTISGGFQVRGESQFAAVLKYTGSGTAITLTTPSGILEDIGIQSTTGHGSAAVGIDIHNSQELTMSNVAFGGGATSGFTTCMRLRSSGFYVHGGTMSWCDTDVLLDLDSAANVGMHFDDTLFFQSSNAAFEALDIGNFTASNIRIEAVQNVFLVDNTASSVVVSGSVVIEGADALLLGSSNGHTFTNPQFVNVNGNNGSNSIVLDTLTLRGNRIQSAAPSYCNTFSKTLSTGGSWRAIFEGNNWFFGCSTAVMTGDMSGILVQARDELLPNSQPEFDGGMLGTHSIQGSNGTLFNYNYDGVNYAQLEQAQIYHPDVPVVSACGSSPDPAIGANSNDRAGSVVVGGTGGGAVSSCTITFGDPFITEPWGSHTLSSNANSISGVTYGGAADHFVINGTNLQGNTFTWTFPRGN